MQRIWTRIYYFLLFFKQLRIWTDHLGSIDVHWRMFPLCAHAHMDMVINFKKQFSRLASRDLRWDNKQRNTISNLAVADTYNTVKFRK